MNLTKNSPVAQAQLWIGKHEDLVSKTQHYLQKKFCTSEGCTTCRTCISITEQQHHAVTWLYPEKNYTLSQLEGMRKQLTFTLDVQQHHFFIIQKSDFLTPICANSLLKSLEEPTHGYHFILLAHRLDNILPTIQSRCTLHSFLSTHATDSQNTLFPYFTSLKNPDPSLFLKILDTARPHERETVELLDTILAFWLEQSRYALIKNKNDLYKKAQKTISLLKNSYENLPMPGSSKLFLKQLFLQING